MSGFLQVFGIFGFTNEDHIGKIFFPATEVLYGVHLSLGYLSLSQKFIDCNDRLNAPLPLLSRHCQWYPICGTNMNAN